MSIKRLLVAVALTLPTSVLALPGTTTPPFRLPTQTGHSGEFLTTNGTTASWAAVSGGLSGTLTATRVPFASGASALVDDADMTFATDTLTVTKLSSGQLNNTGTTAILRAITYTLPAADASGCLQSNGSGALSWASCGALAIGGAISGGTATRVLFEGAGNVLAEDADFVFATDTATITKVSSGQLNNTGSTMILRAITYTLPAADASGVLTSNGAGALTWSAAGSGTILGTIANTQVAVGSAADTIAGSSAFTSPAGGTMQLTPAGTGTNAIKVVGTNLTGSDNAIELDLKGSSGSALDVDFSAVTQAGTYVGISLDYKNNVTVPATGAGTSLVQGFTPAATTTSGSTVIDGFRIDTSGAVNNSTAGSITWTGVHLQPPAPTEGASGSTTVYGLRIQDGGAGSGTSTVTGIQIDNNATAAAATTTGVSIGSGWDTGVMSLSNIGVGSTAFTPAVAIETFRDDATSSRIRASGEGNSNNPTVEALAYNSSGTIFGALAVGHARGTRASPTATQSGDTLGDFQFAGFGTSFLGRGVIRGVATETWSGSAAGNQMEFYTAPNGSTTSALALTLGQDKSATFEGAPIFNAATMTYAVDTAVTLTGGVNGLRLGSTLSVDSTNVRVGIGDVTDPGMTIEAHRTATGARIQASTDAASTDSIIGAVSSNATATGSGLLLAGHQRGSRASPTATQSGDTLGTFGFAGHTTGLAVRSSIFATATETWSGSAGGNRIEIGTTPNASSTIATRIVIDQNGNVGIGTDTTPDARFTVGTGWGIDASGNQAIASGYGMSKSGTGTVVAGDCDAAGEAGRFYFETDTFIFSVCTGAGGWKSVTLA